MATESGKDGAQVYPAAAGWPPAGAQGYPPPGFYQQPPGYAPTPQNHYGAPQYPPGPYPPPQYGQAYPPYPGARRAVIVEIGSLLDPPTLRCRPASPSWCFLILLQLPTPAAAPPIAIRQHGIALRRFPFSAPPWLCLPPAVKRPNSI